MNLLDATSTQEVREAVRQEAQGARAPDSRQIILRMPLVLLSFSLLCELSRTCRMIDRAFVRREKGGGSDHPVLLAVPVITATAADADAEFSACVLQQ